MDSVLSRLRTIAGGQRAFRNLAPAAAVALALVVLLAAALPRVPRQPLWGAALWSLVVLVAFAGWGSLLAWLVARRERIDLGLRIAWGASAMLFVGGVLIVPSWMKRDTGMALIDVGLAGAFAALVREHRGVAHAVRVVGRFTRQRPTLAVLAAGVVAVIVVHFFAGIAEWHTNPYDDDIAYLSFVRKLQDTGSFPEPFSFRRLAALGGQTFFLAIVGIRTTADQANAFDRSICIALLALLVVGHRVRGRRISLLFAAGAAVLVPLLPLTAINTAAHFSAVAFFVALYRSAVWADATPERSAWKTALPLGLVGAAVCTLRQNYLPVPAVFLAVTYVFRLRAQGGLKSVQAARRSMAEPLWAIAFSLAAMAPWLVSAWQSNRTFLYPLMLGTFNRALVLQNSGTTIFSEIRLFAATLLEGVPIPTIGLFVLAALLLPERRSPRQPLLGFAIASFVGFALLVHSFSQSDGGNLGRYVFGFVAALAVCVALAVGTRRWRSGGTGGRSAETAAIAITLVALLVQISEATKGDAKFYAHSFRNIETAAGLAPRIDESQEFWAHLYHEAQLYIPANERMAVLVDEPHWLDFRRNPIWNLDMPGYSSLPPGMPFFKGSQALEDYLRGIGVHYLAFVSPERSKYHYRREYWLTMLVDETELWRAFAPYLLDTMDNLAEIAGRRKHVYDNLGITILDLQAPAEPKP